MVRLFITNAGGPSAPEGWTRLTLGEGGVDPTVRLPFDDNSVDAVMCLDVLDLIPPEHLILFLGELHRLIKPGGLRECADGGNPFEGGLIRLVVANVAEACRAYMESDGKFFDALPGALPEDFPLGTKLAVWISGSDKRNVFDQDSLLYWVKSCGFDGMYRSAYRKSLAPDLRGDGVDPNRPDRLFVECWKQKKAA